nr:hypothetical protein [Sphingomonas sp. PAMC 26621]
MPSRHPVAKHRLCALGGDVPGRDFGIQLFLHRRLVAHRCRGLRRVRNPLRNDKTDLARDCRLDVALLLDRLALSLHAGLGHQRRRAGHAIGVRQQI